ncbi:MAG: DUF5615 family PIN-like protein [Chloroflexota bacterium]|nr:DUF5615 family PIN-like protein [Chloroflexota bacterium]
MRLVIDENMSPVIATLLRNYGHDVIAVAEESPRLPDPAVMEWAVREDRILVTSDNDFGALIYHQGLPSPPAVVLFRVANLSGHELIEFVAETLREERDWEGFFWVAETGGIRRRRLPP